MALVICGARQIWPIHDTQDWPVTDDDAETFKEDVLVNVTKH